MAAYVRFTAADGSSILVAADEGDVAAADGAEAGILKAGLTERTGEAVAQAQATFEAALERVLRHNLQTLVQAVGGLGEAVESLELTFGIKATGEVGNFAVGKLGGDANFGVKIVWKPEKKQGG